MKKRLKAESFAEELDNGLSFEMIYVEGDDFMMGGSDEEARDSEKPIHPVELSSFFMGKYPVTQDLWESVMGENLSRFKGEKRPVENVSWHEAQAFLIKLSGDTGKEYRLPSESEWEYAARGGIWSEGFLYAGSDKLKEVGWYKDNSGNATHEVGELLDNELGIYDMSGNLYEWCEDDYHGTYEGAPTDGSAWIDSPERGDLRVLRGGSYRSTAQWCRVSGRDWIGPGERNGNFGFRLCLSSSSEK